MSVKCPKCQHENPDDTVYCGKCATQLPSLKEIEVTETIETPKEELTTGSTFAGRYQIIEELGKGGMGRVYKVLDKEVNAKVALKLIKPEIASDKKTIERFRNELKIARDIAHKNVCRMYDLGKEEGAYYITMEYVSGEDLKSFIWRAGFLSSGKAISIANQVCGGLLEAHRLGVVHRDLKPQNIMIDKEGNARIMDFGIARSLRAKGITGSGVMIGTPEYMSPEQVDGKEADQRADIYSLGVILYEMVTGRVPFEGDTPFSIGVKQKSESPKPPKAINEQIPADLNNVILKCMEKDKDNRYQSVGELQSELMGLEKGIPTTERIVPERRPLTSREITVQFSLKKLFIPALVVIVVIIFGLIWWKVLPKKKALPLAPSDEPSLAVMYFENNTGDEDLDHYRKAISDLLITDLSQSKYLDVISGDMLFNILEDLNLLEAKNYSSRALKEVASQARASHLLQGNYTKAGDTFRINIMMHEANTMKRISSEMVEGIGEKSIFSMVDEITRRIKSSFKISADEIITDIDEDIERITTSSPEAFKYYVEGRRYHNSGDYRKSIQVMERAVEIDAEFAMAYRSLSVSYSSLSLFAERSKYIKKALEFAYRLSDRERYQITADFYSESEKTYDKAIEAFKGLLDLYPEDTRANHNLGRLFYFLEQWDEAIRRLEVAVKYKTEFVGTYTILASCYRAQEMYEKARETLEYYITNFKDEGNIRQALARLYMEKGELDIALAEADKAFILEPGAYENLLEKGDIYLFKGDLGEAEQQYQKLMNLKEPAAQAWSLQRLALLYKLQGKFEQAKKISLQAVELAMRFGQKMWISRFLWLLADIDYASGNPEIALKECEQALNIARESDDIFVIRVSLHAKGLAFLKMKDIDEAQGIADELKKLIEEGLNEDIMRLYHHLAGCIELEKENFSLAKEQFEKALSLDPYGPLARDARFLNSLAKTNFQSGDLEKARREYELIVNLTTGRREAGDIYAKSFYMLGKIHEQQGDTANAIEQYEKFLDLWKGADPGIAEVDDAKKRLTELRTS
jgi:serine/threonine protein kinase/lipopolysaccharide biosynthesis regulator YciM